MPFSINVFINCPFDDDYFPILRAILFCLIYLDYNPLISETTDSGANRLSKLKTLIGNSSLSIHDISRVELNSSNLPRFNMPFECGIDFGFKLAGRKKYASKSFLILEKEKYRYQIFMSDIAGNDIRAHDNDPEQAIKHVRDWIKLNTSEHVDWPSEIWLVFNEFMYDHVRTADEDGYDPQDMNAITFSDLIGLIKEWIKSWRK